MEQITMKRIKVMQKNARFLSRMRFRLELRARVARREIRLLWQKPRPIIVLM